MPKLLTEDAKLVCRHLTGDVKIQATQDLVTIAGRRVLLRPDPEGRPISGCAIPWPLKPCTATINVLRGYAAWITVLGRPVCLDTLGGFTDGSPPGVVEYQVADPGQQLVEEA